MSLSKIKYIIIALILLLAANSFGDAKPKNNAFGKPTRWTKDSIAVCLDAEALKIKNIEKVILSSMSEWNKIENSPKLILVKDFCDINVRLDIIWFKGLGDALAVTDNAYDNYGKILYGQVIISSKYKNMIGDASKNYNLWDLEGILTHELGHVLGLDEDYNSEYTVMGQYTLQGDTSKRKLKPQDIRSIQKIYGTK